METTTQIEMIIEVVSLMHKHKLIDNNNLDALLPLRSSNTEIQRIIHLARMLFSEIKSVDLSKEIRETIMQKYLVRKGLS